MIQPITTVDPTEEHVRDRLRDVIDPEVGIGIIDLGLVYDIAVDDRTIAVTMTMTTPACPLGPYLEQSVEYAVADLAGHRLIRIDLVFDPPWDPDMISEEGGRSWGGSHDQCHPRGTDCIHPPRSVTGQTGVVGWCRAGVGDWVMDRTGPCRRA